MLSGPAVAWADRGASGSSGSSPDDSADGTSSSVSTVSPAPSRGVLGPAARQAATPDPSTPADNLVATPQSGRPTSRALIDTAPQPAAATVADAPRGGRDSATAGQSAAAQTSPTGPIAEPAGVESDASESPAATIGAVPRPAPAAALATVPTATAQAETAIIVAATPAEPPVSIAPTVDIPAAPPSVTDQISSAITSVVSQLVQTFSGNSPLAPPAESPAAWALLAFARRQPAAAAAATTVTAAATTATATGPTLLVLNGYNVVAASKPVVTAFYGPFINWPAYPGIQSEQSFNLVDPSTKQVVGSFRALQSTLTGIFTSRELVVTEVLSGTAGTAAGQVPPLGSLINSSTLLGFGTLYTAIPAASGNVTSFKLVSPFGDIAIPFPYDGAKGLTDYGEVNKPLTLDNGVTIAPTKPSTMVFTAITGLPPLFTNIQGTQDYTVYDKNGTAIGSFGALVTTTSDALGLFTKMIKVMDNGGATNPEVPPVGTVYNLYDLTDDLYALYSSTPSATGKVKNVTKVVTPLGSFDLPFDFNAATPPTALKPLQVPNGYKLVPTSDQPIIGVNGLPPREMITQGYQQFDVIDFLGKKIGSVNADVTRQWDSLGGYNDAILITKINSGDAGVLPWNVPPVGSVFNIRRTTGIDLGIYDFYSSIPTALGDVVAYGTITPLGFIPTTMPSQAYLSAGLGDAVFVFVDPFAKV